MDGSPPSNSPGLTSRSKGDAMCTALFAPCPLFNILYSPCRSFLIVVSNESCISFVIVSGFSRILLLSLLQAGAHGVQQLALCLSDLQPAP